MRNTLKKILDSITPEKEEQWRQDRIKRKNSLTLDFQLGVYVGLYIINNYLPTLSTDMLQSRKVIQVSDEDAMENKKLDDDWIETTKHGGKWDGVNEGGDKQKWELFLHHNKMLTKKYLPNPLKCHIPILNIQNMDEFKKGLKSSLWDCDICYYNIEPENIKVYDDVDFHFSIIELSL